MFNKLLARQARPNQKQKVIFFYVYVHLNRVEQVPVQFKDSSQLESWSQFKEGNYIFLV